MTEAIFDNKVFKGIDYSVERMRVGEYDACSFIDCNISDSDLSNINFIECSFDKCNLSNSKLKNTMLNDVKFANCKLLGLNFSEINDLLLTLDFKNCLLNFSSFYKLKLKVVGFTNCSLHDVDFSETVLTNAVFDNCDLSRAIFDHTVIEKADFRTSYNFTIDPEINRINKAKFSLAGIPGLLGKYDIEIE